MAQPLTRAEVESYCEDLRLKDLQYASHIDSSQFDYLIKKPRIKNWQEFKIVEDMKRVMIGLHDKAEPPINITVVIKTGIDV